MRIRFAFVCEGSSDRGLVDHLERLCLRAGASEVEGSAPDLRRLPAAAGKTVADQLRTVLEIEPRLDLIFIHRDADRPDDTETRRIIDRGVESSGIPVPPHVKIVPIQELEAWLLLDEAAIRAVAGKPTGTQALGLPPPDRVESTKNPKARLYDALVLASGLSGHRLARFKKRLPELRAVLLQRLDTDGPVRGLRAWQRLVSEIAETVEGLLLKSQQ